MLTITRIKIIVDISISAKIKSFPGNNSDILSGELVSQPKTKLEPAIDASRILLIISANLSPLFNPSIHILLLNINPNINFKTKLQLILLISFP